MDFGDALKAIKNGQQVSRAGWNGKGMFLFLVRYWTFTDGKQDNYPCAPLIAMKTADERVVPWFTSQTDVLAEDWSVR